MRSNRARHTATGSPSISSGPPRGTSPATRRGCPARSGHARAWSTNLEQLAAVTDTAPVSAARPAPGRGCAGTCTGPPRGDDGPCRPLRGRRGRRRSYRARRSSTSDAFSSRGRSAPPYSFTSAVTLRQSADSTRCEYASPAAAPVAPTLRCAPASAPRLPRLSAAVVTFPPVSTTERLLRPHQAVATPDRNVR